MTLQDKVIQHIKESASRKFDRLSVLKVANKLGEIVDPMVGKQDTQAIITLTDLIPNRRAITACYKVGVVEGVLLGLYLLQQCPDLIPKELMDVLNLAEDRQSGCA